MAEQLNEKVLRACAIARGEAEMSLEPLRVVAAKKDVNAAGKIREWWYRIRWIPDEKRWAYLSDERLPLSNDRAHNRRCVIHADVYPGEIVAEHDYKGPVSAIALYVGKDDNDKVSQIFLDWMVTPKGMLIVKLPDGTQLELPNPRR